MTRVSSKSNPNPITLRDLLAIAGAVILVAATYLLWSRATQGIGFPLDDSWIHQTYARNLALRGEWSFRPGIPSAGSTSPLWSFLLAIGFLLRLSPYIWTYALGALTLFGLAVLCEWAARRLVVGYHPRLPWVGIFFAAEWHFAWAALSGMETLLHGAILTLVLVMLLTDSRRYLVLGLLTGLAIWVRPDGITLLGPVLFTILFTEQGLRGKWSASLRYLLGFGALLVFYLLFNLAIADTPMPNTFYAKQAEYADALKNAPWFITLRNVLLQLLVGPSLVLIPGIIGWGIKATREKMWAGLAVFIWATGYITLYAIRLPMYQHGRYIMPAMPVLFLLGLLALADFDRSKLFKRYHWLAQFTWRASVAMLGIAFLFLGASSYANDVALIETEMVRSAKWAAQNLPSQAIIAAHDIGALGYFDTHELIDLAGLITPEVIPFIRDETRLAEYLDQQDADYLIAFPGFYPTLTKNAETVFITNSPVTQALNEMNMAIYRWKSPE